MSRHDPIQILEAAYSLDGETVHWLRSVLEAASPALDRGGGIVAFVTTFEAMMRGQFAALTSTLASLPVGGAAEVVRVGDVDVVVEPKAMPQLAGLTTIELEIARAVASGATDSEIAKQRGTSTRTVSNQLGRLYRKLGLESRAELATRLASTNYSVPPAADLE